MYNKIVKQTQNLIFKNTDNANPTIVLGLSGGPDSVFLFHVLLELTTQKKISLIAAHINHGWRDSAQEDEQFCRNLCLNHDIELEVFHAKDLNQQLKPNGSKEDLGRQLRRQVFAMLHKKHNAAFVALAHHAQDQQETFFMRLFRGSSLSGLQCMKEINDIYLRPLLKTNKHEILDYLHENKLNYCTDETNHDTSFLRNAIRHKVIPSLHECDKRFDKKFASTLEHLQEDEELLQTLTKEFFETIFTPDPQDNKQRGNLVAFCKMPEALQKRILMHWLIAENVSFSPSSAFLHEILKFLHQPRGGQHHVANSWSIRKSQQTIWIEKQ